MQQDYVTGRKQAGRKQPCPTPASGAPRILVVDDEADACEALRLVLENRGYAAVGETSPRRALDRLVTQSFDLVVTDVSMAELDGLVFCQQVNQTRLGLPVILVTGKGTMDMAIAAVRLGARDFFPKPVDVDALLSALERALMPRPLSNGKVVEPERSPAPLALAGLLGRSPGIRAIRELIAQLSGSAATVLLQGETGTGKEVIARSIHDNSPFRRGPFIALNCATVPAGLLESELFGHTRGAYTGARASSTGLLVSADGGTLLLDEIGEMPLAMQPKLLRALQERTVRPLGQQKEVPFNCRLIAATNRDLALDVAQKRFREDLFYRLDVVRFTVPPLRERGDDILLLAQHFLERFSARSPEPLTMSPALEGKLLAHTWPGNVRELENCVERMMALRRSNQLDVGDFCEPLRSGATNSTPPAEHCKNARETAAVSLSEVERRHTLQAIALLGGNKTLAAKKLGIDRRTLSRRLKRYAL